MIQVVVTKVSFDLMNQDVNESGSGWWGPRMISIVLVMSARVVYNGMSNSRILCSWWVVSNIETWILSGRFLLMMGWDILTLQQATMVSTGMLNFGFQ